MIRCCCLPLRPLALLIVAALTGFCPAAPPAKALRVLILSGSNNHDWRQTTPVIQATLEASGKFQVDVENQVASLKPGSFAPYAAILSNFNTFGQKDSPVWDAATRQAFLDHMAKGNGLIIVHAGGSVFYDWPEFQMLAGGFWGKDTSHGAIHINRVTFSSDHPVTRGLQPFWIRDEFWVNTGITNPAAKALASVTLTPGSGHPENLLFATETGAGRGLALMLGHDVATMKNTAWRTLLLRGTEWAATGKVTLPATIDWPNTEEDARRMSAP